MSLELDDRPHNVSPSIGKLRVVMATKNWSNVPGVCSVGLSVTALNIMRVLRRIGIEMESWQVKDVPELYRRLGRDFEKPGGSKPITHVITSAPSFLQPLHFVELAGKYPNTEFVQQNHTGTAYLSIDKFGIHNIKGVIDLERDLHNVRVSWNNHRGRNWSVNTFHGGDLLLPNLYDYTTFVPLSSHRVNADPIRIGSFGASRPWKNLLSAAESAVQVAERLSVGLEYYVSAGRDEGMWGGKRMIESRRELFEGLKNKKLIEVMWEPWPQFRRTVRTMDLLINPSFDETFCVVTADGIAEGTPSVVTGAMEWTPKNWQCDPWDNDSIMRVAMGLLHDHQSMHDARRMLTHYVERGAKLWVDYLLKRDSIERV